MACWRKASGPPRRASRTCRGTRPGRNPGTRTWRPNRRSVVSRASSTSACSTSTDSRIRLPSAGAAVARMKGRVYWSWWGSDHEVHVLHDAPAHFVVTANRDQAGVQRGVATHPPAAQPPEGVALEDEDGIRLAYRLGASPAF